MAGRVPLPIDPHLPELVETCLSRRGLVLAASPGAGKTTRFPPALAQRLDGRVLVLEPRRLAARLAASQVARESGERLGGKVGYQVRFERQAGRDTQLLYVTEGLLTRRLITDPELSGVAAVVLDEFHERHLHTDLALVLLENLRRRRPELILVVMSATIDAQPLTRVLDAPFYEVPGRHYPLSIEHLPHVPRKPLEELVADGLARLLETQDSGDVLAFLPGAAAIRRARARCAARFPQLEVCELFGALPREAQDRALTPGPRRKCILATNLAESSVTVPGVRAVLDTGLARQPGHDPWSGLATLDTGPVCQASGIQRAGRAAREAPGHCLRLYTRQDFERRPAFAAPELLRLDLAEPLLALRLAGVADASSLRWPDPPPPERWQAARALLTVLGALDESGQLTARGRALGALPLHPRLGTVLLAADQCGIRAQAALACALLSEAGGPRTRGALVETPCDLFPQLEALSAQPGRPEQRRLLRVARQLGWRAGVDVRDPRLCEALLAGYPDRVARRSAQGNLQLCRGGSLRVGRHSRVRSPFCIVLSARLDRQSAAGGEASQLAAIEPDWLLEASPDALHESRQAVWDSKQQRAELRERLLYEQLVLHESTLAQAPEASALLAREAVRSGWRRFTDAQAAEQWLLRLAWAGRSDASLPAADESLFEDALTRLCAGRCSFKQLARHDLLAVLQGELPAHVRQSLRQRAPANLRLAGGRTLKLHYARQQAPWLQGYIQDFFGLASLPACGDSSPVVHLLAPNKRAVQVTSDLEGFWQRHYPEMMPALRRRYPKHFWPEQPQTAQARLLKARRR